ncbi:MAG: TlpA family protein disulfide reductase [Burkholderiales bacterium]|nr:TlpA family protein disulfide reductase [Burkholderiales bacterium]
MKRLAPIFACLFALAADALGVGQPAPKLTATTFDGQTFDLARERGQVVIVNFWATWCEPCRAEMPALQAFYTQHRSEGLRLLAINLDAPEDAAKARAFAGQFSFPAAFAQDADYRGYGRIWRMPMTFVIDRAGRLQRDGGQGAPTVDATVLDQEVLPLLKVDAPSRTDTP